MSFGLVGSGDAGYELAEMMRLAELALYQAKRGGRNRVVRFGRQPALDSQLPCRN